jgi:hypothetical protein
MTTSDNFQLNTLGELVPNPVNILTHAVCLVCASGGFYFLKNERTNKTNGNNSTGC